MTRWVPLPCRARLHTTPPPHLGLGRNLPQAPNGRVIPGLLMTERIPPSQHLFTGCDMATTVRNLPRTFPSAGFSRRPDLLPAHCHYPDARSGPIPWLGLVAVVPGGDEPAPRGLPPGMRAARHGETRRSWSLPRTTPLYVTIAALAFSMR